MADLPRIVAETQVGKEADVLVWRDGKEKTFHVKLGRLEEFEKTADGAESGGEEPGGMPGTEAADLGLMAQESRPIAAVVMGHEIAHALVTGIDTEAAGGVGSSAVNRAVRMPDAMSSPPPPQATSAIAEAETMNW